MQENPTRDAEQFEAALTPGRPLVGLDLGTKTIGIAVSDTSRSIASSLTTIRRVKFKEDAAQLIALLVRETASGIVMGLPLNMDGSEGPRAQATRAFLRSLKPLIDLPVLLWDERLSTVAAEKMLIEADQSRKRRAEVIDKTAAAFLLQGALDRLRALRPPSVD